MHKTADHESYLCYWVFSSKALCTLIGGHVLAVDAVLLQVYK